MLSKVPKSSIIVFCITFFIGVLIAFILLVPSKSSSIDYIESDITKQTEKIDTKIEDLVNEKNSLDTSNTDYNLQKQEFDLYIKDLQKQKDYLKEELIQRKEQEKRQLEQWKKSQAQAIIISFFIILIVAFVFALIAYWIVKSKPQGSSDAFSIFLVILSIISFIVMTIALGNNESEVSICFALIFSSSIISLSINRKTN